MLERFLAWARRQPDIQAVALVGSGARSDLPADEWSDLDMIVIASDPRPYLESVDWLTAIGPPWFSFVERTPAGELLERRVLYEGGLDVDLIVLSPECVHQNFQGTPVIEIAQRGMRVLMDGDGILTPLAETTLHKTPLHPPISSEFDQVVSDFWFHTVWVAKKLKRGELWMAAMCCNGYMKRLLLTMIEWHAHATSSTELDTWFNGRFLERWADSQVIHALRQTFAHYETEDVWRAVMASMALFHRLASEVAGHLRYAYPTGQAQSVITWVTQYHLKESKEGN